MPKKRTTNRDHAKRQQRPMMEDEAIAAQLEAVFRKLDSLAEVPKNQLAGKIGVVIDIVTRLPVEIWFQENAKASDLKFEADILNLVKPQTLILLVLRGINYHTIREYLNYK